MAGLLIGRKRSSGGFTAGWNLAHERWAAAAILATAQPDDAVDDECQDQVPRVVPAVCAVVLAEDAAHYFDIDRPSPYMLLVADVKPDRRLSMTHEQQALFGIDKLNVPRSDIPAVTHVDYSARIQTVNREDHPAYYHLIKEFKRLTSIGVIINTSFNVRGEPIVCTPEDAYRCFMRTEIDALVLEDLVLHKSEQPRFADSTDWRKDYELD